MPTKETLCIIQCQQAYKQATSKLKKYGNPLEKAAYNARIFALKGVEGNCIENCKGPAEVYAEEIGGFLGISSTTVLTIAAAGGIFLALVLASKVRRTIS